MDEGLKVPMDLREELLGTLPAWPEEISDAARALADAVFYEAYSDGDYAAQVFAQWWLDARSSAPAAPK